MTRINSFVGTGWQFPIDLDITGAVAMASGASDLEQAMYLILSTSPGERPMRPEFGCRLAEFVFAPGNATTAALLAAEVRWALLRWEPRVVVEDVVVSTDPDDAATLWIDIRYTVKTTNDRRNLVFPFYTIPEHDAAPLEEALPTGMLP
jgi:phage baseplate assembly protein W